MTNGYERLTAQSATELIATYDLGPVSVSKWMGQVVVRLQEQLRQAPKLDCVAYLIRKGEIDHDPDGDPEGLRDLLEKYREVATLGRGHKAPAASDPEPLGPNQSLEVLTRLMGVLASQDAEIVEFRRTQLADNLISKSDVPNWVASLLEHEGPHTRWAEFPLDGRERPIHGYSPIPQAILTHDLSFDQFLPDDEGVIRGPFRTDVAVADGGVLDWLRKISERVSDETLWRPYSTTTFILTGEVPQTPQIRGGHVVRVYPPDSRTPNMIIRRVRLDIHSSTLPTAVTSYYRKQTGRTAVDREGRSSRVARLRMRPIRQPERLPLLVAFVLEHGELDSWEKRMRAWNQQHPEYLYAHASNMQRHFARALQLARGENTSG